MTMIPMPGGPFLELVAEGNPVGVRVTHVARERNGLIRCRCQVENGRVLVADVVCLDVAD
jgi:hypothetical protein